MSNAQVCAVAIALIGIVAIATTAALAILGWQYKLARRAVEEELALHELPTITDQPPPRPASGDIWKLVIADMEQRRLVGIERYGAPLQARNGRDSLVDAYQEVLDLAVYLRQTIEKRDSNGCSRN